MPGDYVTDGKIGVDLTATYASTSAGSTTLWPATPGERVAGSNNSTYIFARAESDIALYDVVAFGAFGDSATSADKIPLPRAVPITTAGVAQAGVTGVGPVGFAQTSIASGSWGWIALNGMNLRANCLISCNPKVPLFTTSTAGKLDDATVSAGWLQGVVAITSATSASAPFVLVNNPGVSGWGAV